MLPERGMNADQTGPADATEARDEAVSELRKAILSLQTGELRDAWNHAACAQAWMREIPNVAPVQAQG